MALCPVDCCLVSGFSVDHLLVQMSPTRAVNQGQAGLCLCLPVPRPSPVSAWSTSESVCMLVDSLWREMPISVSTGQDLQSQMSADQNTGSRKNPCVLGLLIPLCGVQGAVEPWGVVGLKQEWGQGSTRRPEPHGAGSRVKLPFFPL